MRLCTEDQWFVEYERILDEYPLKLTREEAMQQLKAIGFHPAEAYTILDEQGVSDED